MLCALLAACVAAPLFCVRMLGGVPGTWLLPLTTFNCVKLHLTSVTDLTGYYLHASTYYLWQEPGRRPKGHVSLVLIVQADWSSGENRGNQCHTESRYSTHIPTCTFMYTHTFTHHAHTHSHTYTHICAYTHVQCTLP